MRSDSSTAGTPILVADIGGTHARFGIARNGIIDNPHTVRVNDYPLPGDAIEYYLRECANTTKIDTACLAVAGTPGDGNEVTFTNHPVWKITRDELIRRFAFTQLTVINDFVALSLSLSLLTDGDKRVIGGGKIRPQSPQAVVGTGTGLGVSFCVGQTAVLSEGGHIAFAPQTEVERILWQMQCERFGRVSAERVLSGAGLEVLHYAQAHSDGRTVEKLKAADIITRGLGADENCHRVLHTFCGMLGAFAGDVALLTGASGGVYIGGGIALRLADIIENGDFRRRFEDKGRMSAYVAAMPTFLIMDPRAALRGAAYAATLPDNEFS